VGNNKPLGTKFSQEFTWNLGAVRIAASSSRNAVSFSSARTMKRFPVSRWASAMNLKIDADNPEDRENLCRAVLDLVAARKMGKQKGHG
jgi:hypothetical protein